MKVLDNLTNSCHSVPPRGGGGRDGGCGRVEHLVFSLSRISSEDFWICA